MPPCPIHTQATTLAEQLGAAAAERDGLLEALREKEGELMQVGGHVSKKYQTHEVVRLVMRSEHVLRHQAPCKADTLSTVWHH